MQAIQPAINLGLPNPRTASYVHGCQSTRTGSPVYGGGLGDRESSHALTTHTDNPHRPPNRRAAERQRQPDWPKSTSSAVMPLKRAEDVGEVYGRGHNGDGDDRHIDVRQPPYLRFGHAAQALAGLRCVRFRAYRSSAW